MVSADGVVNRRFYTLCALTRLHDLLRRREVFVPGSRRWGDPRTQLLHGDAWERARTTVCQSLGRSLTPQPELAELAQRLDDAFHHTAALLPTTTMRIEQVTTAPSQTEIQLVFPPLERIPEPESLQRVRRRLPTVDLPELLLELHLRTGFADECTHVSESRTRLGDLPISLCAVLLAEARNIGLAPVTRQGVSALERERLSYVQQNYVRPETLARALGELGRIPKMLQVLSCVDEAEHRQVLVQLNKGESRHSLARKVFHGHKGEVRQRYREGQEEHLSALGLVVNAIILWNTLYMDRALEEMR